MEEKTVLNYLNGSEKTVLNYLYGLDGETPVVIYLYIGGGYKSVIINKAKELLWCLSDNILETKFYSVKTFNYEGSHGVNIFIQVLA